LSLLACTRHEFEHKTEILEVLAHDSARSGSITPFQGPQERAVMRKMALIIKRRVLG
jgi:hypothetical protein